MSPSLLAKILPCTLQRAKIWAPELTAAMKKYGIVTNNEIASFIAQISHESAALTRLEENLNYSDVGLANTWPSRYRDPVTKQPNMTAKMLARRPTAIANNCYANRMGNGDIASGDGWRYRGRGPIMMTGKDAYLTCGKDIGFDLVNKPDLVIDPQVGALVAGWVWHTKGLDKVDDDESQLAETRLINGGTIGLAEREALFKSTLKLLQGATA